MRPLRSCSHRIRDARHATIVILNTIITNTIVMNTIVILNEVKNPSLMKNPSLNNPTRRKADSSLRSE